MRRFLLALVLFCLAPLAARADDVFIGNKPFQGQVYGVGNDIRFSLLDLGQALGLPVRQTPEGWLMNGRKVRVSEDHGVVWIALDELSSDEVRVVRNKEFGTIDLYRLEEETASGKKQWGGDGVLVFFGASWDSQTRDMRTTMTEIERSQVVRVVYVDVEDMDSPAYKDFDHLFQGQGLPYFVLLDSSGRRVHSFRGFRTYSDLLATLKQHIK
jgi:hypothetical protein